MIDVRRLPRPARPHVVDVLLAGFVGLLLLAAHPMLVTGTGVATSGALLTVLSVLWSLMYVVPLLWRRADADLCALAIIPAHVVQLIVSDVPNPGNLTVPLLMFSVAARGRLTYRLWWLFFGFAAALIAAIDWTLGMVADRVQRGGLAWTSGDAATITIGFIGLAGMVAAAWAAGAFVRARGEAAQANRDAVSAQLLQHQQAVVLATAQERQRLAREMHDVVAHSLAVIVVQADGGAYAVGMDGDPAVRLAAAEKALTTIRTTAQGALGETRRLVGVLRSDQDAELAPASGLADIFGLVTGLADAGRDVRMQVTGDPALRRLLTPNMELAAFRIVQEGLTNAVKHAGEGAAILVQVHHDPAALTVQIRDDGAGAGPSDGLGHGLIGMRERVAAFGGSLSAHDHPDGGFVVTAQIPTPQGAPR